MMIIVSGLRGSGKSYFASSLSQKMGAQYLSSDLTREEMDAGGEYGHLLSRQRADQGVYHNGDWRAVMPRSFPNRFHGVMRFCVTTPDGFAIV